jgi:hypothetical protein
MKLRLHNYAVIIANCKQMHKFKINGVQSVQKYAIAQNFRILRRVIQRKPQHKLKVHTIAISKTLFKENNNSNKTFSCVHNISLYRTLFV